MRERYETQGSKADPTPGSDGEAIFLADLLLHTLRYLLNEQSPERAEKGELRLALRAVCDRARTMGLRAEQLLLILKGAWRELPERQRLAGVEEDVALARLVSACIDEYYLTPRMDREPRRGEASRSEADHARADSQSAELR